MLVTIGDRTMKIFSDPDEYADAKDKRYLGRLGLAIYVLADRVSVWDMDQNRHAFTRLSADPCKLADRLAEIDLLTPPATKRMN